MREPLRILLMFVFAGGCAKSASPLADASTQGAHATPGVCFPDPMGTGNSLNVGAYCTPGGNQCAQYSGAKFCAIDLDPQGGQFCIKIGCKMNEECGDDACCTGRTDNPVHACIPKGCLVGDAGGACPMVPYPDASVGDAQPMNMTAADSGEHHDAVPMPSEDAMPAANDASMMMANDDASAAPDTGPHPTPGVCFSDPTGTGNSMHIGAYCTHGGHECDQYNLSCAIDLDSMGGNFCIKILCGQDSDCGEEACCVGRAGNPIKACVPFGCVAGDAGMCPGM